LIVADEISRRRKTSLEDICCIVCHTPFYWGLTTKCLPRIKRAFSAVSQTLYRQHFKKMGIAKNSEVKYLRSNRRLENVSPSKGHV
jgi:hypothetical protein